MNYLALPAHLHSTADAVIALCKLQFGAAPTSIKIEKPIVANIGFVTTLHAQLKDHHILCVEVSDKAYTPSLDPFVLECKNGTLPVRLYVASPATESASFQSDLIRAKRNGVGVISVTESGAVVLADAVSLSVSGVRHPDLKKYPLKYRQAVSEALSTFQSGNPSKGCSVLYDEIEALTRRIAKKAQKQQKWKKGVQAGPAKSPVDPTAAWAKVTRQLLDNYDAFGAGASELNDALFGRVLGTTAHRNESGHKPRSTKDLRRRDAQLRTRFEGAADLLLELITAARPLNV